MEKGLSNIVRADVRRQEAEEAEELEEAEERAGI